MEYAGLPGSSKSPDLSSVPESEWGDLRDEVELVSTRLESWAELQPEMASSAKASPSDVLLARREEPLERWLSSVSPDQLRSRVLPDSEESVMNDFQIQSYFESTCT